MKANRNFNLNNVNQLIEKPEDPSSRFKIGACGKPVIDLNWLVSDFPLGLGVAFRHSLHFLSVVRRSLKVKEQFLPLRPQLQIVLRDLISWLPSFVVMVRKYQACQIT